MPDPSASGPTADSVTVTVQPGAEVQGSLRPPGSKSLTNRALVCAAFASGPSTLRGALCSEDTQVMLAALRSLGLEANEGSGGRTVQVDPAGLRPTEEVAELFVGNSGTTVRFLTAALSAFGGSYRLHGVDRMHARPIADLVDAIAPLVRGSVAAISPNGCPPVEITSSGWSGDRLRVAGNVSSQYLSGLMMAAPIALANRPQDTIEIEVNGELVSRPYVEMTAAVMRSFGSEVSLEDNDGVRISGKGYQGIEYHIEPDASAASYFWAAAAISGGEVTVEGLSADALQGDVALCEVLEQMGCHVVRRSDSITVGGGKLRGIDVDMNAISDTVQTLAVVALFADGPTRVRGVAHNRFKETDRIGDLARELRKLGAAVVEHADGLTVTPPVDTEKLHGATLETYHDHRMAMSLSLAGLRVAGVQILNPACTAKTYPEFFADLERLIGRPHDWSSVG